MKTIVLSLVIALVSGSIASACPTSGMLTENDPTKILTSHSNIAPKSTPVAVQTGSNGNTAIDGN